MGQEGQERVPRDGMATSEVAEDTEVESTDADVGEATYLVDKVHGAERSTRRCRVITRVRGEERDHGGLGLRRRGEGIGLRNGA